MTTDTDTTTDPLLGFSPDEIIVGPAGQTLAQAATTETANRPGVWCDYHREDCPIPDCRRDHRAPPAAAREPFLVGSTADPSPMLKVRLALPVSGEVMVSGERSAVLAAVAAVHGVRVDVRRNPQSDDGLPWLVVDAAQAVSYPAYLAEIEPSLAEELALMPEADRAVAERVADLDLIEPAPGYVERAVERARREGVL